MAVKNQKLYERRLFKRRRTALCTKFQCLTLWVTNQKIKLVRIWSYSLVFVIMGHQHSKLSTRNNYYVWYRAYELNVSTRRDKKTICDNLVTSVPNFTSIPNLGALTSSEEHMGDLEPEVQKPSTSSTQHTTRKRKRKTCSSKKTFKKAWYKRDYW